MNKIKKILLGAMSVLTLGLFVAVSAKVNAITVTAEFTANDLNADGTQIAADASDPFYENSLFSLNMTGTGAYVSTIGGEEYDSTKKYSLIEGYTATANDNSGKTYTQAILPTAGTQPKDNVDRGINLTAKENGIAVTIYFTCTDGVFPYTTDSKGNSQDGSYSKSGDIKVAGETISTVSGNKARNIAYAASAEVAANTTVLIESTSNRLALFGIVASYETAGEDQTSIKFYGDSGLLDTIVYDSGDSIDYVPTMTNYTFNGWYTNSDLAEEHKLADNYTVDGTITALYAKFTENAKYTVNYYIDGNLDKTEENVYVGTSITYSPTYDYYNFDGWYLDSNCEQAIASDYTVNGNVDLYGKKVQLAFNLDQAHMSVYAGGPITKYNNTIFNFVDKGTEIIIEENHKVLPDNTTSSYRINKANASATDNRLITFKAPYDGTVKVWAAAGNDNKNFYICEATYSTSTYLAKETEPTRNEVFELTAEIESGKTYVIGGDSRFYIYGIFTEAKMSYGTTASVFAEKNTSGDTLRFIGGISGINDLDDIASIELILKKDGVATKKQIFLTTCYTSVTGASIACDAHPEYGVYYVIYRITGVTGLTGTISKQLKVTFIDGSTLLSEVTEIVLA